MDAMGSDWSEDQISEWSFLVSIMIVVRRMGWRGKSLREMKPVVLA